MDVFFVLVFCYQQVIIASSKINHRKMQIAVLVKFHEIFQSKRASPSFSETVEEINGVDLKRGDVEKYGKRTLNFVIHL